MSADPVKTLEDILKRNGHAVDLRENEVDRYFFFDQISEPDDVDLAWSQFPAHQQIRARAAEVDASSDIIPGWGYRTPKNSNRCSDAELMGLVRGHIAAIRPLMSDGDNEIHSFIEKGYEVQIAGKKAGAPPDATKNDLFRALYAAIGEFKLDHYPFDAPIMQVLYDWATYLTKCNEVVLYLVWPVLTDVGAIDPNTPVSGFRLWQYHCRTNYWIKDGNIKSGLVYVQPPWAR